MQRTSTFLLQGGLDLVTPAIAVPEGMAIAALNYEPDVTGYKRVGGYERFDGNPSPSDGADAGAISTRRAAISAVPGSGPVRGVWIYDGAVYAFRDTVSGEGAMYKSTATGWVQQSFGHVVNFTSGTAAFVEGGTLSGFTSSATATIERAVLRSGTFAGNDAAGYFVVSNLVGSFQSGETITSSPGSATCSGSEAVQLIAGGEYRFETNNFYGPSKRPRMYFTNGVNTAMEWDGRVLAPIRSGTDDGPLDLASFLLERAGNKILARDDGRIAFRFDFDKPLHCAAFANHLFLAFDNGGLVFSGVGEPLDFRSAAGAGTFSISGETTGLLPDATTALMIFGRGTVQYLTGSSSADFVLAMISDSSGAYPHTAQMLDQPLYLDDGGLRRLSTTDAFGDWRMGTVTQTVEPIFRAKRAAAVRPKASLLVKNRDQYRLFWDDNTGITVYFGRERPETMPFKLPIMVSCACAGEVSTADGGERFFVGADDGFVYEMERGTSFDGTAIAAYLRVPWNGVGAPLQDKRFHKATFEMEAPSAVALGVAFQVNYARAGSGASTRRDYTVAAGARSDIALDDYDNIDWTQPDQGVLESWLDTIGRNIALTAISSSATEEAHTLSALTLNFTPRKLNR